MRGVSFPGCVEVSDCGDGPQLPVDLQQTDTVEYGLLGLAADACGFRFRIGPERPGVEGVEERPRHAPAAGVVDVREVLAGPAVGDELFHAAQRTHGVAGRPKCRARVFRRPALVVEHVGDGVHGFEACVGFHRTVAHAQYQHGRRGEALLYVDDHFLDLSGVVGVVVYPRLHDVEPVLQDHQVVTRQGVDLRVD